MKCTFVFGLLLVLLNLVNANNYYLLPTSGCGDENTGRVSVGCSSLTKFYDIPRACENNLYFSEAKETKRSQVKLLRLNINRLCQDVNFIFPIDAFFGNVRELDYSSASRPTLYPHLKFRYLEKFNASKGILTSLSNANFKGQLNLKEIDFSNNFISIIHEGTFDKTIKLSIINLSHNALSILEEETFSKLTELQMLDLSNNQIEIIDNDAFKNNNALQILRLESNPLNQFDCNMFLSLRKLVSLRASMDNITKLDASCAECSLNHASSSVDEFVIRLSGIENDELSLSKKTFENLRYFNIAGKQFQNVTDLLKLLGLSLETLDISSNYLGEVKTNTFKRFTKLKQLKLSNTTLLITDSNPFHHQLDLKSLDISNNYLANLNFTILSGTLENLIDLSIANGQVQNISTVLQLLSSAIESLDLSFNHLGHLEVDTFQRFTSLRSLNLSHTELRNFGFHTFYHQSKLETLDISYNNLRNVDFSLFIRKFKHLITLNLEGNRLYEIDTITQSIFPKLSILGISKNRFSCKTLALFIEGWPNLSFIYNPTGIHIDGVDCELKD